MKAPHRVLVLVLALAIAGCGGPRVGGDDASSRISIGDMRVIIDDTVAAIAASEWIALRTPDSPPAVVSFQEMVNASDDVITRSELWYLAQGVASTFADRGLRQKKNVTLVVPAERARDARRRGTVSDDFAAGRDVTHTMTCVIDNFQRQHDDERTDYYIATYQLTRIADGAIEWTGDVEFERKALGRSFN